MELFALLVIGFILGIEHATDADHVVAVSTIISEGSLKRVSLVGFFWGVGHSLSLFASGLIVLIFKIPTNFAASFEIVVGVMLIILGALTIRKNYKERIHIHAHRHDSLNHRHFHEEGNKHGHKKSFIVGIFHGLAGTAVLSLLVLATTDLMNGVLYIAAFGIGSILSMVFMSTAIGMLMLYSSKKFAAIKEWISLTTGIISMIAGCMIIARFVL